MHKTRRSRHAHRGRPAARAAWRPSLRTILDHRLAAERLYISRHPEHMRDNRDRRVAAIDRDHVDVRAARGHVDEPRPRTGKLDRMGQRAAGENTGQTTFLPLAPSTHSARNSAAVPLDNATA